MSNHYGKLLSITIAGSILFGMPTASAATTTQPTAVATQQQAAAHAKVLSPAAKKSLDHYFDQMIGDTGTKVPGLGVILYKDGKEVYSKFAGDRSIDTANPKNNKPITRDTRFRAASVSKQFTVFTLMQLAEQGKIRLDDDVSQYLGFTLRNPAHPDTPITIRMLASHTSSLRDGKVYSIPPEVSVREFFSPAGKYWEDGAHFANDKNEPGTYYSYCNLNYGLIGTIIEAVTGERFDLYQKEHILKQLDIKADYVPGNLSKPLFAKLGTVYQKKNDDGVWKEYGPWYGKADDYHGVQPAKDSIYLQNPYAEKIQGTFSLKGYKPGTNATMFSPQGGLRISYEELTHSLEMLMNHGVYHGKRILQPASVDQMLSQQWTYNPQTKNGNNYGGTILSYGLGLYQIDGTQSARVCKDKVVNLVGHTGEAFGLLSGLFFRPGTKDGFIYMTNGEAVAEDDDPRSAGQIGSNYSWEENIMNALCQAMTEGEK